MFSAFADSPPVEEQRASLREAAQASLSGDPIRAVALLTDVVASPALDDEERLEGVLQIAHAYRQLGNADAARAQYNEIVANDAAPLRFRCHAQACIAEIYAAEGDYDAARALYGAIRDFDGVSAHCLWDVDEQLKDVERLATGRPRWDLERTRTPAPVLPAPGATFYVAPYGDDASSGGLESPFATLERAREAMREARAQQETSAGGVTTIVRGGTYRRSHSFVLGEIDSGEEGAPMVYRAYPGERPRFTGSIVLEHFAPVDDAAILERLPENARNHVLQCNLADAGIHDYGELSQRGMSIPGSPLLELYFNGAAMRVARWPNSGFVHVAKVDDVGAREEGRGIIFKYEDDRPSRWAQAKDIWMRGYWYHHWADATLDVVRIDEETKRIHTSLTSPYDIQEGQHYYYFNLLEEIEAPGEWYLERETGILYFYPPGDMDTAVVELSVLREPMVVMEDASHVMLQGLHFDVSGDTGVVVRGGAHCALLGCTLSRLGNDAVQVKGGVHHLILGCDMFILARKGIDADCGDRATLRPGNLIIENNHIHDFSRIDRSYTPAVWLDGVGNRIAHNLFHDSPHQAMRIEGNDHDIVFNEIHSVVYETDDQSGLDMWGDPSYRGNAINFNFWHHIGSPLERHGQAGIRLDDAICGVQMYGNVFYRSAGGIFGAIQIHGGKENVIDNNLFISCKYAISFSHWPPSRWREFLDTGMGRQRIRERVNITEPPYSERYPELARIEDDPNVNLIQRNLSVNCGEFLFRASNQLLMDNLEVAADPGFHAPRQRDFSLSHDAPVYAVAGFRPIPFALIGLYEDAYRATWPVVHEITEGYVEEIF